MTEVVHCKSKSEAGVESALRTCAARWLTRVVSLSAARVVVLLGRHAARCGADVWGLDVSRRIHFDVPIGGRARAIAVLPHPSAWTARTFAACVDGEDLGRLQAALGA